MIFALAQITPCWNDPSAGLMKAEGYIREAADKGASLIAFPEQFATGWDPTSHAYVQDLDGTIISVLRHYARKYAIFVLGSFRETHSPHPYNTAVAIGPDGAILSSYAKIHLFSPAGEGNFFDPGERPGIFTVSDCHCGIAICYDLRFADLFRLYRDAGVTMVLVPSSWPAQRQSHFLLFSRSRAVEFQMYIAAVNITGNTPVDSYCGGSCVINPHGDIIAEAGESEELLLCEISPDLATMTQLSFPISSDEKPDLFSRLLTSSDRNYNKQ